MRSCTGDGVRRVSDEKPAKEFVVETKIVHVLDSIKSQTRLTTTGSQVCVRFGSKETTRYVIDYGSLSAFCQALVELTHARKPITAEGT